MSKMLGFHSKGEGVCTVEGISSFIWEAVFTLYANPSLPLNPNLEHVAAVVFTDACMFTAVMWESTFKR